MKKIIFSFLIAFNLLYSIELPPEPNPKENESTLEGIDSNYNGVRDDVEIKIYKNYYNQLQRELLMEGARQFQKILDSERNMYKQIERDISKVSDCHIYLRDIDKDIKRYDFDFILFLETETFNTLKRSKKYKNYNKILSKGFYSSMILNDWSINSCNNKIKKILSKKK